jgi:hypothetical protein
MRQCGRSECWISQWEGGKFAGLDLRPGCRQVSRGECDHFAVRARVFQTAIDGPSQQTDVGVKIGKEAFAYCGRGE